MGVETEMAKENEGRRQEQEIIPPFSFYLILREEFNFKFQITYIEKYNSNY